MGNGRWVVPGRPRCAGCRRIFLPDPRVGARQKVCSRAECQQARRRRTQAEWRRAHAGYFIERRAKKRMELQKREDVEAPRTPPPLSSLPWRLAQEEFGVAGADFIARFGRVLVRHAKNQRRTDWPEVSSTSIESGSRRAQSQRDEESARISPGPAPPG